MPPTIDMWYAIVELAYLVLFGNTKTGGSFQGFWPYMVLPLDFILGLTLVRSSVSTIQNITGTFRKK
jgi:hypothetical protein